MAVSIPVVVSVVIFMDVSVPVVVTEVVIVSVPVAVEVVIHICWVPCVAELWTCVVKILSSMMVAVHWVNINVRMIESVVSTERVIRVHLLFEQSRNTQALVGLSHC